MSWPASPSSALWRIVSWCCARDAERVSAVLRTVEPVAAGLGGAPVPRLAEDGARQQPQPKSHKPKGFVHAFLDSTLPKDVIDQSVELVKGDFTVEKKTLLSHAATSDEYDLFSKSSERRIQRPGRLIGKVGGGSGVPKRPRQPRLHNPGVPMMTTVKEQMAGAKSGKAQD